MESVRVCDPIETVRLHSSFEPFNLAYFGEEKTDSDVARAINPFSESPRETQHPSGSSGQGLFWCICILLDSSRIGRLPVVAIRCGRGRTMLGNLTLRMASSACPESGLSKHATRVAQELTQLTRIDAKDKNVGAISHSAPHPVLLTLTEAGSGRSKCTGDLPQPVL